MFAAQARSANVASPLWFSINPVYATAFPVSTRLRNAVRSFSDSSQMTDSRGTKGDDSATSTSLRADLRSSLRDYLSRHSPNHRDSSTASTTAQEIQNNDCSHEAHDRNGTGALSPEALLASLDLNRDAIQQQTGINRRQAQAAILRTALRDLEREFRRPVRMFNKPTPPSPQAADSTLWHQIAACAPSQISPFVCPVPYGQLIPMKSGHARTALVNLARIHPSEIDGKVRHVAGSLVRLVSRDLDQFRYHRLAWLFASLVQLGKKGAPEASDSYVLEPMLRRLADPAQLADATRMELTMVLMASWGMPGNVKQGVIRESLGALIRAVSYEGMGCWRALLCSHTRTYTLTHALSSSLVSPLPLLLSLSVSSPVPLPPFSLPLPLSVQISHRGSASLQRHLSLSLSLSLSLHHACNGADRVS